MNWRSFSRHTANLPWVTLLLSNLALLLLFKGEWAARFSLDRAALEAGELWRLLTGHWAHWSPEHLGWSLLVFFVLGMFLERTGRRRMLVTISLVSALAISAAVYIWQPGLSSYRGLSGIDCALVMAVACEALNQAWRSGQRGLTAALILTLVACGFKLAFELTTGSTIFVSSASSSGQAPFSVVPQAHLAGGLVGILVGTGAYFWPFIRRRRVRSPEPGRRGWSSRR